MRSPPAFPLSPAVPGPADEVLVLDCETTGLNPRIDEVIAVAAIVIRGSRIMTSEAYKAIVRADRVPTSESIKVHRLRARDVAEGRPMHEVFPELLRFIGGRPIVGYYVDFDVRMLDKYIFRYIEAKLTNRRIEVSEIYFALKYGGAPPGTVLDLRFQSILVRPRHSQSRATRCLQRCPDDRHDVRAAQGHASARRSHRARARRSAGASDRRLSSAHGARCGPGHEVGMLPVSSGQFPGGLCRSVEKPGSSSLMTELGSTPDVRRRSGAPEPLA